MKSPLGILFRVIFLLLTAALLAGGFVLARFSSWRADALARLAEGAEVIETNAGPQQVAVEGEGRPVLILHGGSGGYDQGLLLAEALGADGLEVIAPSRPGYLGTPMNNQILPEQQARAAVALLDALNIQKVAVVGFSAGAPAAVYLAAEFPHRVERLVLISGVLTQWKTADQSRQFSGALLHTFTGDVGAAIALWMAGHNPALLAEKILPFFHSDQPLSGAETGFIKNFVEASTPLSPRESGIRNDIFQIQNLPPLPTDKIRCPTLVVHGTADQLVPSGSAREFASQVKGAIFLPVAGSGHLIWIGPDADRSHAAIAEFLRTVP